MKLDFFTRILLKALWNRNSTWRVPISSLQRIYVIYFKKEIFSFPSNIFQLFVYTRSNTASTTFFVVKKATSASHNILPKPQTAFPYNTINHRRHNNTIISCERGISVIEMTRVIPWNKSGRAEESRERPSDFKLCEVDLPCKTTWYIYVRRRIIKNGSS